MPLLTVVLTLLVIGVLLGLFETYVTFLNATIRRIIEAVVIISVVIWLLDLAGLLSGIQSIRFPHR